MRHLCLIVSRIVDGAPDDSGHYGKHTPLIIQSLVYVVVAGLELARLADLPEDVIVEAQRVADKLSELEEREHRESHTNKIAVRRKALLRVTLPTGSDISEKTVTHSSAPRHAAAPHSVDTGA